MSTAYYNGRSLPLEEVSISPLDRGFLFGDSVYEVIPCYGGKLFCLRQHLDRLSRSLTALRIKNPLTFTEWSDVLNKLVSDNNNGDQLIYLQVTRGVAPREHRFPDVIPTVFAMSQCWQRPAIPEPVTVITAIDNRWNRCDIKATTLLANVLFRQNAVEAACSECLLIRDGLLIEGAASNVFVLSNGIVRTPPCSSVMLSGISRQVVLDLLGDMSLPVETTSITVEDLGLAEELWITSSSMEVRPVIAVDGRPVGSGVAGPVCECLFRRFRKVTNTNVH